MPRATPELCDQAWHSALDGTLTAHAAAHVAACAGCARRLRAVRGAIVMVRGNIPMLPNEIDEWVLGAIKQSTAGPADPQPRAH